MRHCGITRRCHCRGSPYSMLIMLLGSMNGSSHRLSKRNSITGNANLPVYRSLAALPADFDRPMLPTYCGARLSMQLSEELTRSLKTFSRQQSVTMFMTLFATFSHLAVATQRPGRHRHWFDDRRTQSPGDRRFDRVFHQCPPAAQLIFPAIQAL